MGVVVRPPIVIRDDQKVLLSLAPKDAKGDAEPVGAYTYTWTVINQVPAPDMTGDVVTLVVADDQFSATASAGVAGACTISVKDNADDVLEEQMNVTVTVGEPSALNLSAGTPVPETPATP